MLRHEADDPLLHFIHILKCLRHPYDKTGHTNRVNSHRHRLSGPRSKVEIVHVECDKVSVNRTARTFQIRTIRGDGMQCVFDTCL